MLDKEVIQTNTNTKKGNSILNNAKYSSDNTDEWYTTYETIAEELAHYEDAFMDKVVLCNCDDPYESNFCYFFLRNFNKLKLKKAIKMIERRLIFEFALKRVNGNTLPGKDKTKFFYHIDNYFQ